MEVQVYGEILELRPVFLTPGRAPGFNRKKLIPDEPPLPLVLGVLLPDEDTL